MNELAQRAGQTLVIGFEGHTLPEDVREDLQAGRCGGVVLFARNIATPEQVRALCAEVYAAANEGHQPLPFVGVDQEGGRVQRVREPMTRWPAMGKVGATRQVEWAAQVGEALGLELDALGFNLNFAPVVDLDTHPDNPIIGDRSFGADPELVSRMAGAFVAGQTIAGVVSCAKHFPGHGDTTVDSHLALPVVDHPLEFLRKRELVPFARLIAAGIPMIMTAHLRIPAIDTVHPMTLSESGIGQLLRVRMRYNGVVVSDDLEMAGVADHYSIEECITLGLRAGVDLFLVCRDREKARRAWDRLQALTHGHALDRERLQQAVGRVLALKKAWLRPWAPEDTPLSDLPLDAHRTLVERILARAAEVSS